MKYGIIGTGAIGGYYGAKLAYAGQEVHFLLRSDYEYVRQHGLQVDFVYSSARQVKTWPLLYNLHGDLDIVDGAVGRIGG